MHPTYPTQTAQENGMEATFADRAHAPCLVLMKILLTLTNGTTILLELDKDSMVITLVVRGKEMLTDVLCKYVFLRNLLSCRNHICA